ncbi:protein NYNRIN-like [Papaver somniferum]|uniref:protein NYNRIN-like n=1 Tax=Papaver somniferum TaxID=3469 RepID=UPI000E6F8B4F|nr:protein NYNRIN-like [Papaver somniferum]
MSAQAASLQDSCADCQAPLLDAEVCTVDGVGWRQPYIDFIQNGKLPSDRQTSLKIQKKATRFFMHEGILYRRSYNNAVLRRLSDEEVAEVITRSHNTEHQGMRNLFLQLYEGGWALDIIGHINPISSKRHKYIITAIEDTTKWVEVIPLKDYVGATIATFIKECIICIFGAPMIIREDNAKSFVNKDMMDLLQQYNVRLHTSTPYYPQGNGQAEPSNKTLIRVLRRIVEDHPRECHEQLPLAVWAYRISKRSSTGVSPYSLVYGEDAILTTEIAIPSARVSMASHTTPDEVSRFSHLDTIEERRARAERFAEAYRKRTTYYYNQNVKERIFEVEDLVLKIAPHVQCNASAGKFAANWEGPFRVRKVAESGYYKLRRMNGTKIKSPINGKWLKKFYA